MSYDPLFDVAREVVDEIFGEGEYARLNRDNPGVPIELRGGPVLKCQYCEEEIEAGEASPMPGMHRECAIRSVVGSAAHQLKECSCYGGTREDPPNLSIREAAKLAAETFRVLEGF